MKIGITCYPTFGGSGAVATELGLLLAARGHEVHFVTYAQPFRLAGGFRERVFFHEVEMESYPLFEHPPYSLALAVALHDAARDFDLDLVHVHYAIPHATSAWIAREMLEAERSLPVLTTLHGTDITLVGAHPSFQAITRFSILRSDGVSAVSTYLKEETVSGFGIPPERIEVIPNFVDPEWYRRDRLPCHRATLAPGGEAILMHVSNFRPVKRAVDTVEILARVLREVPARLVLVGDGPDRTSVLERAQELGVSSSVVFVGKHSAVNELLACADLFLLPSTSESFGLAALEAMASGVPVIATRSGGLPELVTDGVAGALLPVGDVEGMADAALALLRDRRRWEATGSAARAIAIEGYSAARIVPQYEAWYERTVRAVRSAAPR